MYGLPKAVPGVVKPRSGVATGVGVVWESERTGKTEEKTRVWWSMVDCGGAAGPRFEGDVGVVAVEAQGGIMDFVDWNKCVMRDRGMSLGHSGHAVDVRW